MSFRNLELSMQYRTSEEAGSIINDFYLPVLNKTILYQRAVGYFSSSSLVLAAQGISSLIDRGGKMQLIASPHLQKEDIIAIEKGYSLKEQVITERLLKKFEKPKDLIEEERLNYLAWLIINNQLDIKIAILKNQSSIGLYHEKLGIMQDIEGNKIAFSGSSNETLGGLVNNFEAIDVFRSWLPEDELRVESKSNDFNILWDDSNSVLRVMNFPTAVKEKLLKYRKSEYKKVDPEINVVRDSEYSYDSEPKKVFPSIPNYIKLREYQKNAIRSWFENRCQGLLEMATGTGKTITALSAVSKLWEYTERLGVIIVCPYTHLVDQWVEDIKEFNMEPIVAYGGKKWEDQVRNEIGNFNSGIIKHFCIITTNDTFSLVRMQDNLVKLRNDVVFVADEAHHLGAKYRRRKLLENIPYRLALSATPTRWYDDEGTDELLGYFGGEVVFEFGLREAIGKFLTEYYYYPHIIYLTEDESQEYYEITRKLVKFSFNNKNTSDEESKSREKLLIKRARVLSSARNKLFKLRDLMKDKTESKHNIVYCGDSRVDGEKQIKKVIKMLGKELDMNVHSFTAEEDREERKELLERFENGDLQALIAIKCLDEGVDVPATQSAYILASSTNPREFIQRRGRVLRKHKEKRFSYLHDFIVIPRKIEEIQYIDPRLFNIERNLIKRELTRLTEFADLAINGARAHESLEELKKAYNLLDF